MIACIKNLIEKLEEKIKKLSQNMFKMTDLKKMEIFLKKWGKVEERVK